MSKRYAVDAGDGITVYACISGDLTPKTRETLAAVGRAAMAHFCDHYIEVEGDVWAGTYCKLPAGHDGDHSAHYPGALDQKQASE